MTGTPPRHIRPTLRLAGWLAVGLLPATAALHWDAARVWVAGFDGLLLIAFAVEVFRLARLTPPEVERRCRTRISRGEALDVELVVRSTFSAPTTAVDEPDTKLMDPERAEEPVRIRLIRQAAVSAKYSVRARLRGDAEMGVVNLTCESPLGLAQRRFVVQPTGVDRLKILPALALGERGVLDPNLMMAELGIKPIRKRAEGTEFESLRDAVDGEDIRRIDWRATSRRGRLIARNYELEKNHDVLLCLDTGRLMGALHAAGEGGERQTKLDAAIRAALHLGSVALSSGDRVGVMSFSQSVGVWLPPEKGRRQWGRMMDAIYDLDADRADASYVRALFEVRKRQKKRALIVFFTDFVDAEASSQMMDVLGLLARRHAVLFVALRDPGLDAMVVEPVTDLRTAYRSVAAMGLESARAVVMEHVRARGVRALDLVPNAVTVGAIREYLALRAH